MLQSFESNGEWSKLTLKKIDIHVETNIITALLIMRKLLL